MLDIEPYKEDEALLAAVLDDGVARVRVYRPQRTVVVLGRGSKVATEVNVEACDHDGVPIVRRRGGGCAVVVDTGNLVIATAMALPGIGDNKRYMNLLVAWLQSGLSKAGISDVTHQGISDLAQGDQKVGGSCVYRTRDLLYFAATLLVTADLKLLERYLKHPPREPDYRRGRRHRDFVTLLKRPAMFNNADQLRAALSEAMQPPHMQPPYL